LYKLTSSGCCKLHFQVGACFRHQRKSLQKYVSKLQKQLKMFPEKMRLSFSTKHTQIIVLRFVQVVIELQKSIENTSRKRRYKLQALPVSNDPFQVELWETIENISRKDVTNSEY
jgi:hypothetical protein